MKRFYKYGEPMMWLVLTSFIPVILIWENVDMPKGSILYWAIPAAVVATIGFILNGKHIDMESEARRRDFEAMQERHRKMLDGMK